MDSRFVPRTNEEMLKAVNDFKKRQQRMYSRLSSKLEKEQFQAKLAWLNWTSPNDHKLRDIVLAIIVEKTHPDLDLILARFDELATFLKK